MARASHRSKARRGAVWTPRLVVFVARTWRRRFTSLNRRSSREADADAASTVGARLRSRPLTWYSRARFLFAPFSAPTPGASEDSSKNHFTLVPQRFRRGALVQLAAAAESAATATAKPATATEAATEAVAVAAPAADAVTPRRYSA